MPKSISTTLDAGAASSRHAHQALLERDLCGTWPILQAPRRQPIQTLPRHGAPVSPTVKPRYVAEVSQVGQSLACVLSVGLLVANLHGKSEVSSPTDTEALCCRLRSWGLAFTCAQSSLPETVSDNSDYLLGGQVSGLQDRGYPFNVKPCATTFKSARSTRASPTPAAPFQGGTTPSRVPATSSDP